MSNSILRIDASARREGSVSRDLTDRIIARAGVTFNYTEAGPKGTLEGKRAILVMASGGVPAGSPVDYATTYMKHVLGFVGITEVDIVAAEALAVDADAALKAANDAISALAA